MEETKRSRVIGSILGLAIGDAFLNRLSQAGGWLSKPAETSPRKIAGELGNGNTAVQSCVTSLYAALSFRSQPFEELLDFIIKVGGDVDSIAAMACAMWGAARGFESLPDSMVQEVEQDQMIVELAKDFADSIERQFRTIN